jgi:hypothetical protein
LNRDRDRFAAAGAPPCLIGQGTPADAARFRNDFGIDLDLLVDGELRAYRAAGTKVATLGELLGPKVVLRGLRRARESRVVQGRIIGHAAQLGGLMLVTPGGDIPWAHLSRNAGDYPPNDAVLEEIRSALLPAEATPAA